MRSIGKFDMVGRVQEAIPPVGGETGPRHYFTAGGAAVVLGVSRTRVCRLVAGRRPQRVRDVWTGQTVSARVFTPDEVQALSGALWRESLEAARARLWTPSKARRPARLRLRGVMEALRAGAVHRAGQRALGTQTRAERRRQQRRGIGPARGLPAVGVPTASWVDGET